MDVKAAPELPDNYNKNEVNIDAKAAIAIDSKTGQLLYGKNINKQLPIASMTKLVTVYLTLKAIDQNKINWDTKVTPTQQIFAVASNREYSNVPLRMKHTYTIRQLYQATLINLPSLGVGVYHKGESYSHVFGDAEQNSLYPLASINYANNDLKPGAPLLNHGVYSWHSGKGVDEGNIWGDYFYFEALMRFYEDWKVFW